MAGPVLQSTASITSSASVGRGGCAPFVIQEEITTKTFLCQQEPRKLRRLTTNVRSSLPNARETRLSSNGRCGPCVAISAVKETAALGPDDSRQPPYCIIAKDLVQHTLGQSETWNLIVPVRKHVFARQEIPVAVVHFLQAFGRAGAVAVS